MEDVLLMQQSSRKVGIGLYVSRWDQAFTIVNF